MLFQISIKAKVFFTSRFKNNKIMYYEKSGARAYVSLGVLGL